MTETLNSQLSISTLARRAPKTPMFFLPNLKKQKKIEDFDSWGLGNWGVFYQPPGSPGSFKTSFETKKSNSPDSP